MRNLLTVLLVVVLSFASSIGNAGTQDGAVVVLHVQPHPAEGADPCAWDGSSCSDFNDYNPQVPAAYDIYLFVAWADADPGIAALSCGINYGPNLGMLNWTFCGSGQEWPNDGGQGLWPARLSGNRMTFDPVADCQTTEIAPDRVHALFGSFYVYAYASDLFFLTPNNNLQSGPEFQVGDCGNSVTDLPGPYGWVGFGTIWGCGACGMHCGPMPPIPPIAVRTTTWGSIKAQY